METLIIKIKNEEEFNKVMKIARRKGYGIVRGIPKTHKTIIKAFRKEINKSTTSFCLRFNKNGLRNIEYQTSSYFKDFYYDRIQDFDKGIELLSQMELI